MSNCEKYLEMISAMVDGELTAEQEVELRTHIDQCGECAKVYDAFMSISNVLADDLVAPPETLAKGIMYKINLNKKGGAARRFAIGRYTAIAACLALVLFGASHFGLLGGLNSDSSEPVALSKAANNNGDLEMDTSLSDAAPNVAESYGIMDNSATGGSEKAMLTTGAPVAETSDGTVVQFGFSTNTMTAASVIGIEEKEPTFLFDAKEIRVFEGKYYAEEENEEKNKLLFTLSSEKELSAFSEFLTALPNESAEYVAEDVEIIDSDPLLTLYVPADTKEDENAKDKIINVWFVDGKLWCFVSDVDTPKTVENFINEKILYKATGLQEKFEAFIKEIDKDYNIT